MDSAARPILFVGLPESGLLNPLLVLAGELARRGVPDLWFATDEHRRDDVAALAADSAVSFASLGEVVSELSAVTWDDAVYREVTQSSRFKAHRAVVRQSYRPALQARKYRALEKVLPSLPDRTNVKVRIFSHQNPAGSARRAWMIQITNIKTGVSTIAADTITGQRTLSILQRG